MEIQHIPTHSNSFHIDFHREFLKVTGFLRDFRIPPASRPSLDSPDELRRVAAVLLEVPEANRPPRKWQAKLATAALLWWANPRDLRCQNDSKCVYDVCLYQAARSQVKLICQNLLQASPTCKPIDCTPPCTHWTVFHLESFSHLFTSLLKPDKCGPWSQEQTKQLQRSCLGKLDKTRHGTTWCNLGRSIQFLSKNDIHSQNTSFIEEMARYLSVFFSFWIAQTQSRGVKMVKTSHASTIKCWCWIQRLWNGWNTTVHSSGLASHYETLWKKRNKQLKNLQKHVSSFPPMAKRFGWRHPQCSTCWAREAFSSPTPRLFNFWNFAHAWQN